MTADNVIPLRSGAGSPAPGPRVPVDLDGVGDRYTALLEARHRGDPLEIALLEGACADDVPGLVAEIGRKETLRRELADEVDRLREVLGAHGLVDELYDADDYDPDHDLSLCQPRDVVTELLPGVSY